jgi:RNA recognition motif-containing protein
MNIYVGNLPLEASETDLQGAFSAFGQVASATIIKDKFSGESRGFGFVEMPAKAEAEAAITGLNGTDLKGRTLTVNEARPRPEGGRGGGRRNDRRGGGGGGGDRGDRRGGGGGRRSW